MNGLKKEIVSAAIGGIAESQVDTIEQRYRFSPDFIGFCGHFPGYPILPAFVQILMALTLAEEHKGCPLEVARIEKAKFHIPLRPDQEIKVECRSRRIGNTAGCEARLTVSQALASSFRITFIEKGNGG